MTKDLTVLANLVVAQSIAMPELEILTFVNEREGRVETRTFGQLLDNANALACYMASVGMKKGDCLAALLQNHAATVEAFVAASIGGFVVVPIDPRTKGDKLQFMLKNSRCRGLLCADYNFSEALDGASQENLEWVITLSEPFDLQEKSAPPITAYSSIMKGFIGQSMEVQSTSGNDDLQILYTSGTTGDPKGIVKANAAFASSGVAVAGILGLTKEDRVYSGLSLTHGNAQGFALAVALANGIPAVFSQRFTKSQMWDTIRKHECTFFTLLGGMTTAIFSDPPKPDDVDNPVRLVMSSGMPATIWKEFEKRFGVRLFEAYGAAEGGIFWNDGSGPVGSFGHLTTNPLYEARIVDEEEMDCPANKQGELIWRPRNTEEDFSVEYLGKEDASSDKTRGGWFRTGDIVHVDDDNWMFFDYRAGGGIRRNGDFVNPGFVEKVVAECNQVTDVFVYGVPIVGGTPGEKDVIAAIVLKDAAPEAVAGDVAEIFKICSAKLERNFVPTFLHIVDEIPKTASEKPQERFLLEVFSPNASNVHTQ